MSDTTTATTAKGTRERIPPQPYEVLQNAWDNVPGEEVIRRKNRSTGTQIPIKKLDDETFVTGCVEHGYITTPVIKWGRICDIARQPREWCPECKDAPAPEKKERKSNGGVPLADQTPEQRAAYQQQALEAQAAKRREAAMAAAVAALESLPTLSDELEAATASYEQALNDAGAEEEDLEKMNTLFDRADNWMRRMVGLTDQIAAARAKAAEAGLEVTV